MGENINIFLELGTGVNIDISFANVGPQGPPGTPGGEGDGSILVKNEFHTGLSSDALTLDHDAIEGTLDLYKNGSRLPTSQYVHPGGADVTLAEEPEASDEFIADYKYMP